MNTAKSMVKTVKGIAKIENAFHQLRWVILEYNTKIKTPSTESYIVRDYATANFRENFNQYPYSDARIIAAYSNNQPTIREDRSSVEGQYVILELAVIKGVVEDNGIYKPPFTAGVCTWRQTEDGKDWRRNDFSDIKITQVLPVEMVDGTIIAPQTVCTLKAEDVITQEIQLFNEEYINLEGYNPMFVSWHLPTDWQTSTKKYPLVVSLSGGGGMRTEENGHDSAGGHLTRDRAATAWLEADESVAILTPQIGVEDKTNLKNTMDCICKMVENFIEKYPIDRERVYCIGSSLGGLSWSTALSQDKYAKIFTAYIQCNSHFTGAASMFLEEFDIRQAEQILSPLTKNFTDFSELSLRKHGEKFFQSDDFVDMKKVLKPIVDNRVFVDIWHGANDEVAPVARGITTYLLLQEMYRQEGLNEEDISKVLRLNIIPTHKYHELGIFSYHQASKIACSLPEMLKHTLSIKKSDLKC